LGSTLPSAGIRYARFELSLIPAIDQTFAEGRQERRAPSNFLPATSMAES
jgi:hypothetical protein